MSHDKTRQAAAFPKPSKAKMDAARKVMKEIAAKAGKKDPKKHAFNPEDFDKASKGDKNVKRHLEAEFIGKMNFPGRKASNDVLRKGLIRLAYQNPELRPVLLPMLHEAGSLNVRGVRVPEPKLNKSLATLVIKNEGRHFITEVLNDSLTKGKGRGMARLRQAAVRAWLKKHTPRGNLGMQMDLQQAAKPYFDRFSDAQMIEFGKLIDAAGNKGRREQWSVREEAWSKLAADFDKSADYNTSKQTMRSLGFAVSKVTGDLADHIDYIWPPQARRHADEAAAHLVKARKALALAFRNMK